LALGEHDSGGGPQFNMTALAVRTANAVNGVSRLHGQVTRDMWASVLEPRSKEGAQLLYLTNGVHVPTWVSAEMAQLFERHLGFNWRDRHDEPEFWNAVGDIPDEEVWAVRQALRTYLFHFIRERARDRWSDERVSAGRVVAAGTLLDPSALTVGFARRFTGYKRPELLFHDPARLAGLLSAPRRPIQLLFAGKSHPADDIGKHHLQRVFKHALDPAFAGRIAFVDDYDLHVAHFLVQGCDVWLNTPRKPLEASGTSGMKAAINGTLHLSIGDGWWAEGYDGSNGWLIDGARADDPSAQDANDAAALYTLLEERIVPAFYDRDETQIPRTWVRFVKEAIRSITPQFSARRMVKQYVERMYLPAVRNGVTK
jgi:starch phosphorylase